MAAAVGRQLLDGVGAILHTAECGIVHRRGRDRDVSAGGDVKRLLRRAPHALLSATTRHELDESIAGTAACGGRRCWPAGNRNVPGKGYRYASTVLRVSGKAFLAAPEELQREAFGNEVMVIVAADEAELLEVAGASGGEPDGDGAFVHSRAGTMRCMRGWSRCCGAR